MKHIVIIGNSAAGISAVEAIREWDKDCKITIISDENTPFYSRCLLPNYLAGEMSREDMIIRNMQWYEKNDVNLILGKKVLKVDEKEHEVILVGVPHINYVRDNTPLPYDSLLIATGSSTLFPPIDGINNPMVFGFRTLSDVERVLRVLPQAKNAIVLGAGFIGLKAAYALWKRGVRVTIIEKLPHILPRMLDTQAASIIANHLTEKGIELRTNSMVTQIMGNKRVTLDTGEFIKCNLLIVAVGVKPNIELIENTGIEKNEGILVDEYMRTNVPDVYAAGDVAEGIDFLSGRRTINAIWPSATRGGRIAGYNIVGIKRGHHLWKRYDAELPMNAIEFFSIPMVSMGIVEGDYVGTNSICAYNQERNIYKKIVLQNGKIVGMVFVGDIRKAGIILSLIKKGEDVSLIKSELLAGETLVPSPMTTKFRNLLHYPI